MDLTHALDFARTTRQSVLITTRGDGRPQLSNVWHHVGDDGLIRVSITATRAKYRNLARDPWAAFHVTTPDFNAYAVLEGEVTLTPVAAAPDDATVDALVAHYGTIVGAHDDWDEFRTAQVDQQRVLVTFAATRAYGMLPG
jgi:PPOX class probable F420-dependent enzyme